MRRSDDALGSHLGDLGASHKVIHGLERDNRPMSISRRTGSQVRTNTSASECFNYEDRTGDDLHIADGKHQTFVFPQAARFLLRQIDQPLDEEFQGSQLFTDRDQGVVSTSLT